MKKLYLAFLAVTHIAVVEKKQILGGNASRINAKRIRKADDAWKKNLNKNLLKKFNRKAGWFNKLMGYK